MKTTHSTKTFAAFVTALSLAPALAQAHPGHPHGTGFSAGLAHPAMGLDHVLAMLAVGLWAAQLGGRARWAVPAAFVGAMTIGSSLGMSGMAVPFVEPAIVASVIILGLLILSATRVGIGASLAIVSVFAFFHGAAHGAEVPANANGVLYTAGFAIMTALLHGIGFGAAAFLKKAAQATWVRFAGAAIAVGGAVLILG